MEGESKCPTSCDYMKLNDSKERVWCFKPGKYDFKKFESKCPMGTGSTPPPSGETPVSMTPMTSPGQGTMPSNASGSSGSGTMPPHSSLPSGSHPTGKRLSYCLTKCYQYIEDMSSPMMSSPMMSSHMMSTHGPHGAMTTGMGMGGHGGRFRSVRDILQNNKFHG